ncbi:174 kDa protein [Penicillium aurantiogriseum fusarivirus 1]|uniref:174 kDa protein n=1 Tax=Penicillium aurantiogriseum fusarivirus 1 TaxID=1755752 RepID=A0A0S2KP81_9VIRU|nr:174 kDa protein [Penicillium aurantiogriseum fusarivirus 1]ALO50125.1 174 kDa protein [Penicillium aurantiogriseum fusarivirus 1]
MLRKFLIIVIISLIMMLLMAFLPVLLMYGFVLPLWVVGWLPSQTIFLWLFFGPLMLLLVSLRAKAAIDAEYDLLQEVGPDRLLWCSVAKPYGNILGVNVRPKVQEVWFEGWHAFAEECFDIPVLGPIMHKFRGAGEESFRTLGSRAWSGCVSWAHKTSDWRFVCFTWTLTLWHLWKVIAKRGFPIILRLVTVWLWLIVIVCYAPEGVVWHVSISLAQGLLAFFAVGVSGDWLFLTWLKWRVTDLVVSFVLATDGFSWWVKSSYSQKLAGDTKKAAGVFQELVMKGVLFIDELRLPEFIRRRGGFAVDGEVLKNSRDIMAELGWPVNVLPTEPDFDIEPLAEKFKESLLLGSDFKTGIRTAKMRVDSSLVHLRVQALQYKRTETYQSTTNELEATSRYFPTPVYRYPELELEEVWSVLADIFAHSKLTPFNRIISLWEKKYALGFWMKDPFRHKKYRRKDFIGKMGYNAFKRLWAETFYWAPLIAPVAHISVKGEPLPPKKWAANKVRSIVGSPVTQYILSTIFNFGPNHNFAWETTPIKIGMPLNGFWMSRLWSRHARFDNHLEGDMSEFDSTVQGKVVELIKAVRKKGYDFHKDRSRICDLIDINYEQVVNQSLGFTSTGNIYAKGTGLTTGHSSTSMDNSIALTVLYLMAWKELTGLSAREFLAFNELSCFGDDHMLSYSSSRPLSWAPKNIAKVMAKWGVTNNVEQKSLWKLSFLGKFCRKRTTSDVAHGKLHGVDLPQHIVWHDRQRLLGKLTAPIKNTQPTYRLKRLLGYLELTAHHQDIYEEITRIIKESKSMQATLRNEKLRVPTYRSILRRWYESSAKPPADTEFQDEEERFIQDGTLISYGTPTMADELLSTLSLVPDFLNPSVFNMGFVRAAQNRLGSLVSWPFELIGGQNNSLGEGQLKYLLDRTPYRMLDASIAFATPGSCNKTELLIRHWLFLLYCRWRPTTRAVRLLGFIVSKVANWQFGINGVVQFEAAQMDFGLDKLLVVACLSFVVFPEVLGPVTMVRLPDIGVISDLLWNKVLSTIWASVPSNYSEVGRIVSRQAVGAKPALIVAPTGTGKSTAMIGYFRQQLGGTCPKIVVIVPRTILAVGLTTYMKSIWGDDISGSTTGLTLDPSAKVWYVTPQSFFGLTGRIPRGSLVVIDEAHLMEKEYQLLRQIAPLLPFKVVMATATPTEDVLKDCSYQVSVPVASLWSVDVVEKRLPPTPVTRLGAAWTSFIKQHRSSLSRNMKALYVVNTPEQADELAASDSLPSQALSSMHSSQIDPGACRYYATSIVDVGVTIDGLDIFVTPDWHYAGAGRLYKLTPEERKQRKGRVGRTRNGTFVIVSHDHTLPEKPTDFALDVGNLHTFLSTGVSPYLLHKLEPTGTLRALGLNPLTVKEEDIGDVLRASHIYYANLKPLVLSALGRNVDASGGVVLQHTGTGNISSTFQWDAAELVTAMDTGLGKLLRSFHEGDEESFPTDDSLWARLTRSAGPYYNPANLLMRLSSDPAEGETDAINQKNPAGSFVENIYEVNKIITLLASVE